MKKNKIHENKGKNPKKSQEKMCLLKRDGRRWPLAAAGQGVC